MKVIAVINGEKIVISNYNSYIDMDRDLLSFNSMQDLINKMNFDIDEIIVLDNNKNPINYDFNTTRTAFSFFENKKGDQFVSWIYYSACDNYHNKKRLSLFFDDILLKFTKGQDEFNENDISNSSGRKRYQLIKEIRGKLYTYGTTTGTLREWANSVKPYIEKYVKEDKKYNYASMRNFACSLIGKYGYKPNKPQIKLIKPDEEKQTQIISKYERAIQNYLYAKSQVRIEDVYRDDYNSDYDENGIKNDEKEFLEEFVAKKNLHL